MDQQDSDAKRYSWLALGAISVARRWRTPGRSWWAEERISRNDADAAIAGGPVNVMVSHDAPNGVTIPGIGGSHDQELIGSQTLVRLLPDCEGRGSAPTGPPKL